MRRLTIIIAIVMILGTAAGSVRTVTNPLSSTSYASFSADVAYVEAAADHTSPPKPPLAKGKDFVHQFDARWYLRNAAAAARNAWSPPTHGETRTALWINDPTFIGNTSRTSTGAFQSRLVEPVINRAPRWKLR